MRRLLGSRCCVASSNLGWRSSAQRVQLSSSPLSSSAWQRIQQQSRPSGQQRLSHFRSDEGIEGRHLFTGTSASGFKSSNTNVDGFWAVAAGGCMVFLGTTTLNSLCEEQKPSLSAVSTTTRCEASANPLWPAGVTDEDVNAFVKEVLADPSINISALPDAIEAALYKQTVRLVLNLVYSTLSEVHGADFLGGHRLELRRRRETAAEMEAARQLHRENTGIDEHILEQVADRLMANSAINDPTIPDFLERQIYVNCLKLVARLFDTLANTFCVTICGHDLRLHFEPSSKIMQGAVSARSSSTTIDLELLAEYTTHAVGGTDDKGATLTSAFQKKVLQTVYGMVLGILDDIFANTEIKILHDRLSFDIVAADKNEPFLSSLLSNPEKQKKKKSAHGKTSSAKRAETAFAFATGVAVGAAAAATLVLAGGWRE